MYQMNLCKTNFYCSGLNYFLGMYDLKLHSVERFKLGVLENGKNEFSSCSDHSHVHSDLEW